MNVIIAWAGDYIGRQVDRMSLQDDVAGVRHISQAIDKGNEIWKSWVLSVGGSIISIGGDEGRAEVPSTQLEDLEKIRDQYSKAVGSGVSVGVGIKLAQASKSLNVAKIRGGDQIVLYSDEVDKELQGVEEKRKPKDEVDKLAEEYLDTKPNEKNTEADYGEEVEKNESFWDMMSLKDDNLYKGGAFSSAPPGIVTMKDEDITGDPAFSGGISGVHSGSKNPGSSPPSPQMQSADHSAGEVAGNFFATNQPSAPESTNAAAGLEDIMRGAAEKGANTDFIMQDTEPVANNELEQLKQGVVQILQQVRQNAPILEQMKEESPEIYQNVMMIVQAMMSMAHELFDNQPAGTPAQSPPSGDEQAGATPEKEESTSASGEREGSPVSKSEPILLDEDELKSDSHWRVRPIEDPFSPELEKYLEDLEKGLPMPHAAAHHHVTLPSGSSKDSAAADGKKRDTGRVKVTHSGRVGTNVGYQSTGTPYQEGWVQVRAGRILSEDGHAISSRNPSGR